MAADDDNDTPDTREAAQSDSVNSAHSAHSPSNPTPDNWFGRWLASLFSDRLLHPADTYDDDAAPARASQLATAALGARPLPYYNPLASADMAHVRFCVEDTVGLKEDKFTVGVVDRSFGDVDSHEPRPQRDYNEDIERHPDISQDQFFAFLRTGIPPRGTVLVSWQSVFKTELIPEAKLELLDRALYVGDVVKRSPKDPMSGTVIGTKATCTLFPATLFNSGNISQGLTEDLSLREVPAMELLNIHEYVEGALVIYDGWVGRIEEVFDEVAVKLSNNSVVVVENVDELEPEDPLIERMGVGDKVKTKKGNLRRGRWKYGAFDPNVRPHGMVVETRTVGVTVHWLTRRFGEAIGDSLNHAIEPPADLGVDDLDSPNFHVYDAAAAAAIALPLSANGVDRTYHVAEVTVGDRVKFKDLAGAAVKYDGTRKVANGFSQGKLTRIPRTESLGYDMNVFIVMQTHSRVMVQWQDLTVTEDFSPLLIPDPNVEDEDEVWPGEIVCTKEQRIDKAEDAFWTFEPAKVGIVQSVKPRDRIATVRWFENPTIRFLGEDLIPPAETGQLCETTDDVSLYDIKSTPNLTRRRGDFVVIHPDSIDETSSNQITGNNQPRWFGEVIDLRLDGKVTVRLGAAKPIEDVQVPAERVTLVYSSDMENPFDFPQGLDGDSVEVTDDDGSDFDSESFNEMWIEYEGMDGEQPVGVIDDEDWSTEDEDADDDDDSMPDLEPIHDTTTSETTPELHSDNDRRSTMDIDSVPETTSFPPEQVAEMFPGVNDEPVVIPTNEHAPEPFAILESAPTTSHHYIHTSPAVNAPALMKRIAKEHKILRSSLPPGIYVRTWESRLDLLRVMLIGPSDTPYEYAPFIIDFHLGTTYPQQAPEAFFHSWTNGNGPVNPNLYEDGKICLSLLGTWHADERNESWSPAKSTLLQLLVSIMGLVLVKEPYYNEAGYDVHREAPETKLSSALYTERAYFRARGFIVHALTNDIEPFAEELKSLYLTNKEGSPLLLDKAIVAAKAILESSQNTDDGERDGLSRISLGAAVMLKRQVEKLEQLKAKQV